MSVTFKDPSWLVKGTLLLAGVSALTVWGLNGTDTSRDAEALYPRLESFDTPNDDDTPIRRVLAGVPLLPGSYETNPLLMHVNGSRTNVIRTAVDLTPKQILDAYEKIARGQGAQELHRSDAPASASAEAPFSNLYGPNLPALEARALAARGEASRVDHEKLLALTWIDPRGRRISVHALPGDRRGSWYFVMAFENPLVLFGDVPLRDNPGEDPAAVPRPPQARRLLSISGYDLGGFLAAIYESNASLEVTHRYYRDLLPTQGWSRVEMSEPGPSIVDPTGALFFRRDQTITCVFPDLRQDDVVQTTIVVIDLP